MSALALEARNASGHWTEEARAFLRENWGRLSVFEIARATGRTPDAVWYQVRMHRHEWNLEPPRARSRWAPEEDDYLREHVGIRPYPSIAKKLGRTVWGVKNRAREIGVGAYGRAINLAQVAEMFGVHRYTPRAWVRRGVLRARKTRIGSRGQFVVADHELERFIEEHPEEYDPARMTDRYYRNLAKAVHEWDPLYNAAEVGELLGIGRNGVTRRLTKGTMHGAKGSAGTSATCLEWRVRRSELQRLGLLPGEPPPPFGQSKACEACSQPYRYQGKSRYCSEECRKSAIKTKRRARSKRVGEYI